MGETTAPAPSATRSRGLHITLWVVQVLLALNFLGAALSKLFGQQAMVDMFADIGAGQWFRYLVGLIELAAVVGLLIPVLRGLTALCLTIHMAIATIITIATLDDPIWTPLILTIVCGLVAWGRWPETKALFARVFGR